MQAKKRGLEATDVDFKKEAIYVDKDLAMNYTSMSLTVKILTIQLTKY